jgi:hypothetical protein
MSNFAEMGINPEQLGIPSEPVAEQQPSELSEINELQVKYDHNIAHAAQGEVLDSALSNLARHEMTAATIESEAPSEGIFSSLEEALSALALNEDEAKQYTEFLLSAKPRGYIITSNDEVLKIERVSLIDVPIEYVYTRQVPVIGTDIGASLHVDGIMEEKLEVIIDDVVLHNLESGMTVNLGKRMPPNVYVVQSPDPMAGKYNHAELMGGSYLGKVTVPAIKSTDQLATLLHEIGHSWDINERGIVETRALAHESSETDDNSEKLEGIKRERNAWAWAIREARRLRDLGFIVDSDFDQILEADAEFSLSTYDVNLKSEGDGYYTNMMRSLDRKLDESANIKNEIESLLYQLHSTEIFIPFLRNSEVYMASCKLSDEEVNIIWYTVDKEGEMFYQGIDLGDRNLFYYGNLDGHNDKGHLVNDRLLQSISIKRLSEGGGEGLEQDIIKAYGALSQMNTVKDVLNYLEDLVKTAG